MTKNELGIALRSNILAGLIKHGLSTVQVIENYQPTQQGRVSSPVIYFHALPEYRYGWQHRKRKYDDVENKITTTETQWIESSYQIYALAPENPLNLNLPTAVDLVSAAAMVCNSETFAVAMRKAGAGVQRITQIRNPYFVNDRGQFEASPSFDITLSHKRSFTEITPVAEDVTTQIFRFKQEF